VSKWRFAYEVLQRNPRRTPSDERLEANLVTWINWIRKEQASARNLHDVAQEKFGIHPRSAHSSAGQSTLGIYERVT
jgi:hypothetical protein